VQLEGAPVQPRRVPAAIPGQNVSREAVAVGSGALPAASGGARTLEQTEVKRKIGRNDPCWCGSGKKYKKCHGKDE